MADPGRLDIAHRFMLDMARLEKCVAALSLKQETSVIYDQWTVIEVLRHIAAWDRELVRGVRQLRAGRRPSVADHDEAEFNRRAARARRDRSLTEVLSDAREAYEELIGWIEALTDEEWRRPTGHRWANGAAVTVGSLFSYTYKGETHYAGHAREIEDWAAELPHKAS